MLPTFSHLTRRTRTHDLSNSDDHPILNNRKEGKHRKILLKFKNILLNVKNFLFNFNIRNNFKQVLYIFIALVMIICLFSYFRDDIYTSFALQLTNPSQSSEASYGWYRKQLESNMLGNTKFSVPVMAKLGFQDTWTTSDSMFSYFRTFNTFEKCAHQHSSKIFGGKRADAVFEEEGVDLDAVLVLCEYKPPFFINTKEQELKNIEILHKIAEESGNGNLAHSHKIDEVYGENMWRGMRRLSILMCSEAVLYDNIQPLIQNTSNSETIRKYSESPADISICYLSTCSVWVNYLYYPIELAKSALFGKKPTSENSGVCAFVSNCKDGDYAKERYQTMKKLSEFVPIRQYGRCGRNAKEGPGGKQFELENNCKFYFAAENSISKDYITEKFFEGLRALQNGAKLLIIYRGAPNIKDWGFPPSLFININDFKSTEELGAYLKELNDNDEKFEERFAQIEQDRKKVDEVIETFQYKLGSNIPCRITKIIGEMKLARYLLFKIGLKPLNYKVNEFEWNDFKRRFSHFGKERIQILDDIYTMAYGMFQKEGNYKNMFNSGWKFE